MKKIYHSFLSITVVLALMFSVNCDRQESDRTSENAVTLTIIHINDKHGRMDAEPYISALAKRQSGPVLILDAGDAMHGQTTTNLTEGAAMVEIMNEVGYSAMVPGNHDFNFGVDRLLELKEMMNFPLLAANVKTSAGESLFQNFEVFVMNGVRVGVFGLVTPETAIKTDPRIVGGLIFENPVQTARRMIEILKGANCGVIIALAHLGVDGATMAENRSDTIAKIPGIDVVIDGHSHTLFGNGLAAGNAFVAQAGEFAEHIGIVTINVSGNTVTKSARYIDVSASGENSKLPPDERIANKAAELNAANEALVSKIVGHTPVFLQGEREYVRKEETNLANLITNSVRFATGADVAFMGGGNIRASIEAGDITMGDILTVLPFSNLLVSVKLKGSDLLAVLEHGVSSYPELTGKHIQVSGMSFTFDPEAEPGSRVKTVTMEDGGALDPDKIYTVATIDFIAAGGDGYTMLQNATDPVYYGGDVDALAAYLATNPIINSEPEGRVRVIGGYDK